MGTVRGFDIDLFPSDLEFTIYSGEEIKRMSVVKIITGLTFDPLGHPLPGGLYDSLMGTYGRRMEACATCRNTHACPGHIGHVELSALVYNPFFMSLLRRILTMFCLECFKMQIKDHVREIATLQLRLIDAGYIIEAQELELYKSEIVAHNSESMVKTESGLHLHPRIAELRELLDKDTVNNCSNTKTTCAIRTAVVNATLQRPISKTCIHCSKHMRQVRYMYRKLVYYISAVEVKQRLPDSTLTTGQHKIIFADECRKYLRKIYENYSTLIELLFPILKSANDNRQRGIVSAVDLFFMDTLPVTPPKARPVNILRDQLLEHPQTAIYRSIIENDAVLRIIMKHIKGQVGQETEEATRIYESAKGSSQYEKLYNSWQELQSSINVLLDVNMTRDAGAAQGLKQVLEKKEGLLRKHMMGKRVNYAARTVITPDPNINVEEVGIPDVFARKLSYPVPVTPWNVAELRKMVINGPETHPGANLIQDEKGHTMLIPANNPSKRESMAKLLFTYPENGVKVVHRHIINGDVLLLNRQPSLHRPSIMAHKARILRGEKTFRLHYSNCKAYNADFDGDEMNAHLPQGEVARSEAYNLVNVANNYLVPKDGTPLGGLIQDHVISGVKLSIRGRFFNREDYHQLVYQGLASKRGSIEFLPPTILKPMTLWSGKQILSTIIMNLIPDECNKINLDSRAKINDKQWITAPSRHCNGLRTQDMSESQVIIGNGELLVGVLDKQQYGATTFGLIHCIYELYGGDVSTRLLTAFTKIFTNFLQREGFTLGVKDILVTAEADNMRRKIVKECREIGPSVVAEALELDEVPPLDVLEQKLKEAYKKDPKFRVVLDRKYKSALDSYTNNINKACLPDGLISQFPSNNLQLMILSGAKGSLVNAMQISSLLGQIELEGKRPPLMISGKPLPSFTLFETSPKSGGFIDGRFMTGIQPQDFFYHCMAGREGLIDTAVKTSRSGYLQRCLIKHLEGLTVGYDLTVRDSDNSVVQFLYGEDGLDILKSKFIANETFGAKFFLQNSDVILHPNEFGAIKDDEALAKVKRHIKKLRNWQTKHNVSNLANMGPNKPRSAFTNFSAELRHEVEVKHPEKISKKSGRRRIDESFIKLWKKAEVETKQLYEKKYSRCPDPAISLYKPDRNYGVISESMQHAIENFKTKTTETKERLANIMYVKAMKALAAPGEPVGLLAAQSIGEPSTQMTLNTFHFAGRGEMNVTLGIPRLREILMLATSNIKTPSMDIPIIPTKLKSADKLRVKLNRVTVANVLENVEVNIKLVLQPERNHQYQLRFQFLPREAYQDDYCVKPKQVLKYISSTFFKRLLRSLIKSSTSKQSVIDLDDEKVKSAEDNQADDADDDTGFNTKAKTTKSNDNDANSSDDENGNDDDDATGIKLKSRKQDETEYDDPEDLEEIADANVDDDDSPFDQLDNNKEPEEEDKDGNGDAMIDAVMKNSTVYDYIYDTERYLWCKLTFNLGMRYKTPDLSSIIRDLAEKSVMHEVHNIKRSIIYKGENDVQMLKTDGINIVEMFKHNNLLDLNRLYANDIHSIAKTYGIEAAARVITKEVFNVFKVYGINIDRRHLSLIADYMTFDGTFQPLSRKGLEHSSSPLQQMSFESCLQFLRNAAQSGRNDQLNSPSSRLMVGLPVRNGTGAFDLLTKIC